MQVTGSYNTVVHLVVFAPRIFTLGTDCWVVKECQGTLVTVVHFDGDAQDMVLRDILTTKQGGARK